MKKTILFVAAAMMAAVVSAQTVSTSSITFANCTTEYVNEKIYVGELDLPFTYNGVPYVKQDFNDASQVVSVNNTTNERGCDKIVTTTIQLMQGVLVAKPFKVGDNKYVYFSMGNLQYNNSQSIFKFADEQYISLKKTAYNNRDESHKYEDLDLFFFGCTGYSSKKPNQTSAQGSGTSTHQKSNYDFGWYNQISNGGNAKQIWYMLTKAEWQYLFSSRPQAASKVMLATVTGYEGILLLPDDWSDVEGVSLEITMNSYSKNTISPSNWNKLQAAGAIFIPCTSLYNYNGVESSGSTSGYYLTGTYNNVFYFGEETTPNPYWQEVSSWGCAVRLVREAPAPQQ